MSTSGSAVNLRVLILPSIGLAYFKLMREALANRGIEVTEGFSFPRRGILFGKKYDVIHLHMLDLIFFQSNRAASIFKILWYFFVIVPFCRARGIAIVWTCHEWTPHEGSYSKMMVWLARFLVKTASRVIVHNTAMMAKLLAENPSLNSRNLTLLPHGDLGPMYSGYLRKKLHPSEVGLTSTFISLGYMRWNKGTDLIISAFCQVKEPRARLVLIGNCKDQAYRTKLVDLASQDERILIEFRSLADEELAALHSDALAAVFGFRDCPTSGSAMSAMSLGVPVIAPNIGHIMDLIDTQSGWPISSADVVIGLTDAMQAALDDPVSAHDRGQSARLVAKGQDWENIALRLETIYHDVSNA